MNVRLSTLVGALALVLAACPPVTTPADAGEDSGVDNPQGPCTGGCGPLQKCDEATHTCVDGCGGCDAGLCVKNAANAFQCIATSTSCNGNLCSSGQVACLSGTCSCLPFTLASKDTCAVEGSICNEAYSPGAGASGLCAAPKLYEACRTSGCPSGNCAACPTGTGCVNIWADRDDVCLKKCSTNGDCGGDERCFGFDAMNSYCLQKLFASVDPGNEDAGASMGCIVAVPKAYLADGGAQEDAGLAYREVPVSNRCALVDDLGFPLPGQVVPTGNCSYDFMRFSNEIMKLSSCRPPGAAGLNASCKRETNASSTALQCSSGLECAVTRGDTGQCLKMCNAVPARQGIVSQPACGTGESCVNLYRASDLNAVVGVCMPTCDVFSTTGQTCADVGTFKASCVPVPADGILPVSLDGKGICVPQKAAVANLGEACAESDAFKGASCATGLLCRAMFGADQATCLQPCDIACTGTSKPARCATEPNATCLGGKTCTKISGATGAIVGVCK
jgi:hypothetical protein